MRRRLGPPLAGIGGGFVMLAILGYGESGVVVAGAGAFLVLGVVWRLVRWIADRRPVSATTWAAAPPTAFHPAAAHTPSSTGRVAVALGRAEARELTVSAAFGVGVGFCMLLTILFGHVWGPDWGGDLARSMELFPIYSHPIVGMVVLATHRARTRARRDDLEELFSTCPASDGTRTLGHLVTAWLPAVTIAVFLTLMTAITAQQLDYRYGQLGLRQVALIGGSAVLGLGGTALGAALARWTPWSLAPVVALVAIAAVSVHLATRGANIAEPIRQLSTWLGDLPVDPRFTAPNWIGHHLWVASLVGIVALLALARDEWGPRLASLTAVAVVAASVSGVLATRPMDTGDAKRIASLINEPALHQECVPAGEVSACVLPGDTELATHVAGLIEDVAAGAPKGVLSGWVARYAHELDVTDLDPRVQALLRPRADDERLLPMRLTSHPSADEGVRFWTALAAVGVLDDETTDLAGQARGVVVFWLSTLGADRTTALKMTSRLESADPADPAQDRPWPDPCWAGPAPVSWGFTDVAAGRQLLDVPTERVRRVIREGWDRFTDPATTTDELLAAVGLDPLGAPVGQTPIGEECPH